MFWIFSYLFWQQARKSIRSTKYHPYKSECIGYNAPRHQDFACFILLLYCLHGWYFHHWLGIPQNENLKQQKVTRCSAYSSLLFEIVKAIVVKARRFKKLTHQKKKTLDNLLRSMLVERIKHLIPKTSDTSAEYPVRVPGTSTVTVPTPYTSRLQLSRSWQAKRVSNGVECYM